MVLARSVLGFSNFRVSSSTYISSHQIVLVRCMPQGVASTMWCQFLRHNMPSWFCQGPRGVCDVWVGGSYIFRLVLTTEGMQSGSHWVGLHALPALLCACRIFSVHVLNGSSIACIWGGLTSWAGAFLGPFLYISIIFYMCVCRFVCSFAVMFTSSFNGCLPGAFAKLGGI